MSMREIFIEYYRRWGREARRAYQLGLNTTLPSTYYQARRVFFCGMGGSGVAGMYAHHVVSHHAGFVSGFSVGLRVPSWVDRTTLVFAISFSGNTAETIRCMGNAYSRGARVVLVSRGGRFEDIARTRGVPFIRVPEAPAPRAGLPSLLFTVLGVLAGMNIIDPTTVDVEAAIQVLESTEEAVEAAEEAAAKLYRARNRPLILLTGDSIWPVAIRGKNEFAENAKTPIHVGVVPESGHNDIEAWSRLEEPAMILVRTGSRLEDSLMDAVRDVVQPGTVVEIKPRGLQVLERMMWPTWILGLASIELAQMIGVDPYEISIIDSYKRRVSGLF